MDASQISRLGLVVHPRREIDDALATLRRWCDERGVDVVQVPASGAGQQVAEPGEASSCDAIVALGGDGTTLAALRTGAAAERPVMGIACGSLGALTAVTADDLDEALDRVGAGDWTPRPLPVLRAEADGAEPLHALNDLVLVRAGAGQVMVEVTVDDERFVGFGGDGIVAATPLGSTAYTLAAGGPMIAPGGDALVLTPLSPHGGVCPPLVASDANGVAITLDPGTGGARIEVDGQISAVLDRLEPVTFALRLEPGFATLVSLGEDESAIAGLRRRRILIDSPRMVVRDEREAAKPH
jgi:NAD+ kinase